MDTPSSPSSALLAANNQLQAWQETARLRRLAAGLPVMAAGVSDVARPQPEPPPGGVATLVQQASQLLPFLAPHLGWESQAVTNLLRQTQACCEQESLPAKVPLSATPSPTTSISLPAINAEPLGQETVIKLYPALAVVMLREHLVAPGRLWLLLRHLDPAGQGWVTTATARAQFARAKAPLRFCGWRQLRNLLHQGHGIFWEWNGKRIWYRAAEKVALALDLPRFTGRPVTLPLPVLLDSIGAVRAHFYASFHSGRMKEENQKRWDKPIARETLAAVTGVSRRCQRAYEERAGVQVQTNQAIGPRATTENEEELVWQKGQALFTLKDYRGYQGRRGQVYLAWQIPNSYRGPHAQRGRGRQKQLNRRLAVLRMKRGAGNNQEMKERCPRLYYPDGAAAGRAINRQPDAEAYWPHCQNFRPDRSKGLWYGYSSVKEV